jgi:hypothetical protein
MSIKNFSIYFLEQDLFDTGQFLVVVYNVEYCFVIFIMYIFISSVYVCNLQN